MTGQAEHVIVVGAGLGGLRTVEQLRSAGFQGRISLVGAEPHDPYDRPPLSKQILTGDWEAERTRLARRSELEDLGVRVHLGISAVALRPGGGNTSWGHGTSGHELELSDGATLHGDAVVIATGLVARTLPGQPEHVQTLRTLDDALALRTTLTKIESLLVVGGGFIGAEVASSARRLGVAVTVLEGLPVVLARALGPDVGEIAGRLLVEGGGDLRTGVTLTVFADPVGQSVGVELSDGTRLSADAAVVGIGGAPQLEWLAGCGLDVRNG